MVYLLKSRPMQPQTGEQQARLVIDSQLTLCCQADTLYLIRVDETAASHGSLTLLRGRISQVVLSIISWYVMGI
jgi:hypothetical protein